MACVCMVSSCLYARCCMHRRRATFIGSEEWLERDVQLEIDYAPNRILFVKDTPSGISMRFHRWVEKNEALALLAHRVRQLAL